MPRTTTKSSAAAQGACRLRLGASRYITIRAGSMVLVRHGVDDSYGALVTKIAGASAQLTFTPKGMPRNVPLGLILCAVGDEDATLDPSSVPRYQPEPSAAPRRRPGRDAPASPHGLEGST